MTKVKNNKGKTKANYVFSAVLSLIAAAIFALGVIFMFLDNKDYLLKGECVDMNARSVAGATIENGEHVKVKATGAFVKYGSTTNTLYGFIPIGKKYHYGVVVDNGTVISVTAKNKKTIKKLDDSIEALYTAMYDENALFPEPVLLEGEVLELHGEQLKYYKQGINTLGISASDGVTVYELDIDTTSNRLSEWVIVFTLAAFCVGLMVLFFISIKKAKCFNDNINTSNNSVNASAEMLHNTGNLNSANEYNNYAGENKNCVNENNASADENRNYVNENDDSADGK